MSVDTRYRVEVRRHAPDGEEDCQGVIDRMFNRPLTRDAAVEFVHLEVLNHPEKYAPDSGMRLVVVGPTHQFLRDGGS